ncbi:unnamed protein product [Adineta steineri]|uniref:Carrier domain-containing protein n=1 Tax=Adineta steineri TaxID=433720 RepID=A0A814UAV5_9BILA|nr:unnamed protein product [Adineta steineri]CAF1172231.1 unnamed protein product [Adineta steineri]
MPFYKKVQLKVIHDSKYGVDEKAVFAVEKIYKGEELIYEYDPLSEEWPFYPDNDKRGKYTQAELFKLIENNPKLSKLIYYQAYNVDDDLFNVPFKYANMDSDNVDDCEKRFHQKLLINHSCDPNVGFAQGRKCYAFRDIDIGDEITHHYGCIDTVIDQQLSMTSASMFWLKALHGYKFDQSLSLPYDRYRLEGEKRTDRGLSVSFDLSEDFSHHFLCCVSSMNIKLEHLVFATYYAFIFKLISGEKDLCVAINKNSQYRDELKTMIGFIENVVPLRCQLDPHWSFQQLIEHVCEIVTSTIKYSYLPLQSILAQYSTTSKPAFLDTIFEFFSYENYNVKNEVMTGNDRVHAMSTSSIQISDEKIKNKFDFSLTIQHNLETNQLSCTIDASLDLFNLDTIEKIAQRFYLMLEHLFTITDDQMKKPIYELSLVLPDEKRLMQSMNNTQVLFPSLSCIHHEFVCQVIKHPQKLAVELDKQSLTYCELLYYVQVLSLTLLNEYHVLPGEIVCQCVERSLSMVIGIMGIEMAGGVYCPLSPRDPQQRLQALVRQNQSCVVLVHYLTKSKFNSGIVVLDNDSILANTETDSIIPMDRLSNVAVLPDNMAYIIFTSGSTGTPKAAQVRHRNFSRYMYSLVCGNILKERDIIMQISRCSFDTHIQDIMGTLTIGATLEMLHQGGIIDLQYLADVIENKNVTCLTSVPTILQHFFSFLQQTNNISASRSLRSVCTGGEMCSINLVNLILSSIAHYCALWNLYGPAEATIVCTFHRVNLMANTQSIAIGRPLSNYRCMVMNQYLQSSVSGQEGELFVGGAGVFAGYLGRDDLTAKALVEIDGEPFYRTGDVVRRDNDGLLHYQGRKDHQIKLHGQRIELGEIERCLLNITSISTCVVMKYNDDHLIAYVQSSHINEEQLRQHCQSHLPPHMIPSFFIILDKLPLNQNGKVDRKQLPSPDFSHFPSIHLKNHVKSLQPRNAIEVTIQHIWCDICDHKQISIDTNIFLIGGHSLILIELLHRYKTTFHLDTKSLSITDLLQNPTIIGHAQFIHQALNIEQHIDSSWSSLHLTQARASFAQERIFLDEQIRFSPRNNNTIYAIPLLYRISSSSKDNHISIDRLHRAFQFVIIKHSIFRTALYLDSNGTLIQHCFNVNIIHDEMKPYGFSIINLDKDNDCEIEKTISDILNHSDLFDLSKGRVIHCHILRHYHLNLFSSQNDDLLMNDDFILFNIHHSAFDKISLSIFLRELSLAYETNSPLSIEDNAIEYIDYSVFEHQMDMTLSHEFWHSQLEGSNLQYPLSLPFDRSRLSTDQRSGLASIAQISFDDNISSSFLKYASSHHITPFQLGLATFYVFLFKLTHGQNDLCIASFDANRYRSELETIIGMFVATLPYRIQINPHWSFDELVKHVQEKCFSILQHSYYPLQHILNDIHLNQSNVSFLETAFQFITISSDVDQLSFGETSLQQATLNQSPVMATFDFMVSFIDNPTLNDSRLTCSFVCSCDLFNETTVACIAERFQHLFFQLFSSKSNSNQINRSMNSISNLSLILPKEAEEMQGTIFSRLPNIGNEAPASFAQARIWLDERIRFDPEKPQTAIYNMPFVYRLQPYHTLSIKQLRHALYLTVNKHPSLHTSLHFDNEKNLLMQRVITHEDNYTDMFSIIETTYETDEQLNQILHDEKRNSHLFDLAQGLVFRCHLVYYKQISSNHLLSHKDLLIFNFHHALFDFPSVKVFHHDLNQAYTTGQLLYDDNSNLRYLDYAVIEQEMSMTDASMFWLDVLHDCKLDQPLSLPFDRYRLSNEHRTGRGTSISFDFGQDLSHYFLLYTSSNNISIEHLTFAIYFIVLFKLTNGQTDLCLAMNINNNRYRDELQSIIGLFENVIPLQCQLNRHWCFHQLLEHVREVTTNSMKYSYFPLQRILNQHPHICKHAFLDTSLEFVSYRNNNTVTIGDSQLVSESFSFNTNEDDILSVFDFSLSVHHDLNMNQLSCTINASLDLFNRETVEKISQRFHFILHQLSTSMIDNQINKPIYELSLILSNEQYLMQSLNNTQISFSSPFTCVHHEFVYQVMKHPQKLAVELDEQSLTYCELLYYVQVLSFTLLNEYLITPGEVVCQCVERSLSMVIGIMGIEMAGGVYCPLSPRDPEHRLYALTQQTQSRLVLVQHSITFKFSSEIVSCNIDLIWTVGHRNRSIIIDRLSDIVVTVDNIAYIVFTSGSTGTSKGVQIRHRNLLACIDSLVRLNLFTNKDTMMQMASCSYDVHAQEIIGSLISGSTIVMLRPQGNMDLDYMTKTLTEKQVSYLQCVPAYVNILLEFLQSHSIPNLNSLRNVDIGGETSTVQLIDKLYTYLPQDCSVWNIYGPAETTVDCTGYVIGKNLNMISIPIGRPLPNYRCMIMNEYVELSVTGQEGELFVGGAGVFAGYLGRDDLSAKALVEIDGQLFYRTGDLVRMDSNGLLHYQGRKDHQIKLHGQRIELGEIERCLLNITSISACVVMKWKDDYLVAYVQSSHIIEEELREYCQSYLPPHMIPSFFIILDKLPLNPNGKVDRKLLPPSNFSSSADNRNGNVPHTTLEKQLQDIFNQAFHTESPHVDVPFGQLGGTSLSAILALALIRQQVCNKVDIGLLFTNPSIRQLAQAIEPILALEKLQETPPTVNEIHQIHDRLAPSFVIESLGIALLVCQWLLPIMIIHRWYPLLFPILPICHLLFYVICSRLLSPRTIKDDNIFSWSYYRWWFLDRLWNNNTFWLQHLLGTSLYNCYLHLCGARISLNAHIYTTTIDAPWLLYISEGTWIADKTTLNSLYFNDNNTFALHSIKIGCYCSISARSILFGGVDMQDNIIVQPMSSVTGFIASRTIIDGDEHKLISSDISVTYNNPSLSILHKIYEFIVLISLICIHCTLLLIVYKVYSVQQIPLPISIAFCWTLWSIIACFITLFLLKFVVGSCTAGETYPIASWSYLHKVWFRQLIVSSFHHAWLLPTRYDYLYPFILRWLGAQVEDNVKLAYINTFLSYPTNLLKIQTGVTVFGYVLLVPTEMTPEGDHRVDWITLGSHTNLGNICSILPGSHLASHTMVGNLTRVTRETNSNDGDIFIGVPARAMPFQMPIREATEDQIKTIPFWKTCFSHYISKFLLTGIYWSCGLIGGPILHTIIVCSFDRWHLYTDNEIVGQIIRNLRVDHEIFISSFLGNTQWLIRLFRAYGASIGNNVILPDVCSIFDYNLVTIGDNVRLHVSAHIMVGHTFEQRILKLVPVTVGSSCVLMSGSIVMSGCKLIGNNRLYPFTLVMKNDLLQSNTQWKGLPAQSYVAKSVLSRSASICNDVIICEQKSNNFDRLSLLWYEQISNVYKNVNELQFMNWGYADLDEHIDENAGYYSKKLYEQVLANVTLTDQNILEVGCGRGAGAAWCVRAYASRSYVGTDPSRDIINLCQQCYSTIPQLSFMIADPKTHLPFQNESMNVVLSIETINIFDEIEAVTRFVNEITRVLTPNGYFLWCGLCDVDGSSVLVDYLTANSAFIMKEKINITRNVLHALDIQHNSRADFIERYIQPADQEYCRLLAGLPGTQLYNNMQQGHAEYYRVIFRKKIIKNTLHI